KIITEAISITVFTIIVALVFKGETIRWNHIVSFVFIILAVTFAFWKNE
ncbi:MAG: DMT family protein, partial [Bacteroidales bacterium]|nr:DMT family protein [Bacteroidales bacterium]